MSTKKCCRACLKEIRNRTTFTNILEPPSPPIYLRNGVEASSYLQCYYFCLHSNLSDYTNLSDYQYICGTCKLNLLKVAEFIVQSLRNEGFLMSMYDISKQDLISDIAENLLEETRSDDDEQSVANGYDYNEEPEILEDNLQNTTNICEIPNTTAEIEFLNAKYVEDDGGEEGEQCGEFESYKQNINENANIKYPETINTVEEHNASGDEYETLVQIATESYRQSLLQNKTPHDSDHGKWKIIPKDTFNLEFNCLLCRQNFSLQRQLYEHYDNDHGMY